MISVVTAARLDANLSVDDLANRAGVHPKTIRRLEARQSIREETIFEIARVLDLKPSEIVRDLAAEPPTIGPRIVREDYRADGTLEDVA